MQQSTIVESTILVQQIVLQFFKCSSSNTPYAKLSIYVIFSFHKIHKAILSGIVQTPFFEARFTKPVFSASTEQMLWYDCSFKNCSTDKETLPSSLVNCFWLPCFGSTRLMKCEKMNPTVLFGKDDIESLVLCLVILLVDKTSVSSSARQFNLHLNC